MYSGDFQEAYAKPLVEDGDLLNWFHLLQVSLENGPLLTQVSIILEAQDHFFIWKLSLKKRIEVFDSAQLLCEEEDKAVMFVVVYMARNSTNSAFPRKNAQVHLCCSMACGSPDHDIKDITWCVLCEIKCHRLIRTLTGTTARQRKYLPVL